MQMHRNCYRWMRVTLVALLAPLLVSCQGTDNMTEWRNDADQRWRDVRSALMLEMAHQQFETGDLEQCQLTLRNALAVDPENAQLHLLAGRVAIERGQLERGYHLLNAAIEYDDNLAAAYYYRGMVLQRWKQNEQALESYQAAYDKEPDHAGYLLAVAETMVTLDQLHDAIELLESKLTYFDQSAAIRSALGHLHMVDRRADRAVRLFTKASLLSPSDLKIQEELATAQLTAGQTEDAVRTLRSLLRNLKDGERDDLERMLAAAYLDLGQTDEARQIYLKLARREGAEAADWLRVAELAWQVEDPGTTLAAATRAINLAPRDHRGYILAGLVWQQRQHLDHALQMFDRAATLAPASAEPLILRGISLQRAGRERAAAQAYEEALKRQPDDPRIQRLLATVTNAVP